jgi:hypothetical protein
MDGVRRNWECEYRDVFSKWQRAEELCREKDRKLMEGFSSSALLQEEQCLELEHAVLELGELRREDLKEKKILVREKELQSKHLESTLDLLHEQKAKLAESEEQNNQSTSRLQENISSLRNKISDLVQANNEKDKQLQLLHEQNEHMHQMVSDKTDSMAGQIVKVVDRYDLLLSRYMDAFPQDEKDLKVQFVDPVTKRCCQAFRLLTNKCYEDMVCNVRGMVLLLPDPDSFVESIFDLDLDLEGIMYMRVVQCLNPSLFDTLEASLVKQHDLTKHKIRYRHIELTQARQVFLLAYLAKTRQKNQQSSPSRKFSFHKPSFRPVGFDSVREVTEPSCSRLPNTSF